MKVLYTYVISSKPVKTNNKIINNVNKCNIKIKFITCNQKIDEYFAIQLINCKVL